MVRTGYEDSDEEVSDDEIPALAKRYDSDSDSNSDSDGDYGTTCIGIPKVVTHNSRLRPKVVQAKIPTIPKVPPNRYTCGTQTPLLQANLLVEDAPQLVE